MNFASLAITDRRRLDGSVWVSARLWALVAWWCILSTSGINLILVVSVAIIGTSLVLTGKLPLLGARIFWPLLALCALGLTSGLFRTSLDTWEYARDFFYLFKVPLIATATICLSGANIGYREVTLSILVAAVVLSLITSFCIIWCMTERR